MLIPDASQPLLGAHLISASGVFSRIGGYRDQDK
jgi:hypothetical protein